MIGNVNDAHTFDDSPFAISLMENRLLSLFVRRESRTSCFLPALGQLVVSSTLLARINLNPILRRVSTIARAQFSAENRRTAN